MLGLAVGLRARSTLQAILVTLVTGLIGGFFIPLAAFGVGPGVVGHTILTMSPPVHCYFLALGDSPFGPPGAISIAELRYVAAGWTTAFAVASVLLYRAVSFWGLVPIGWGVWGYLSWQSHRPERTSARRPHPWAVHTHRSRGAVETPRVSAPDVLLPAEPCQGCPDHPDERVNEGEKVSV